MTSVGRAALATAAIAEAATGAALLASPSVVIALLLDAEISGAGIVLARIAGMALIGLGIASWPRGSPRGALAMMLYSAGAFLYMGGIGMMGTHVGWLWWPAVAVHALFAILLGRALAGERDAGPQP